MFMVTINVFFLFSSLKKYIEIISHTEINMFKGSILKHTDESLGKFRRVQTNEDESQTNVDECRRVQTSHQTNIDECIQVNRRVQRNVDKYRRIKNFYVDSRKSDTWSHFFVVANMQQQATSLCKFSILKFYLLLLLVSFLTPVIRKTHLPIS